MSALGGVGVSVGNVGWDGIGIARVPTLVCRRNVATLPKERKIRWQVFVVVVEVVEQPDPQLLKVGTGNGRRRGGRKGERRLGPLATVPN